jgi:hypothetical protein
VSSQGVDPGLAWRLRYLLDPPRAQVTHSVAQAIAAGQITFLAFDTRIVNVGGVWLATANTRLTAPVSGWYDVWAQVDFANGAGTYRSLAARLNGATFVGVARVPPAAGGVDTNVILAFPIELVAGDYLELRAGQDTAAPLNAVAASPFSPRFDLARRCDKA